MAASFPPNMPASAVIAAAGTNQSTATLVAVRTNVVTTVASGTGIRIPAVANKTFVIVNRGANGLLIYPPTGGQFEAFGANSAALLPAGEAVEVYMITATQGYMA